MRRLCDLSWKVIQAQRAMDMAEVVECLLSKHKALSSNASTIKRKKKVLVMILWVIFFSFFLFGFSLNMLL
jgi:hypothetical protein